jgi:hypothetical protein
VVAGAVGVDVVVVEEFVVAGAEQDEVVEFGLAAVFGGGEVVCFEFAAGAATGNARLSVCGVRVAGRRRRSARRVSARGRDPSA